MGGGGLPLSRITLFQFEILVYVEQLGHFWQDKSVVNIAQSLELHTLQ